MLRKNILLSFSSALLMSLVFTSCGTTEQATPEAVESQSVQSGTGGQLIAIDSDNVRAAGFNASSSIMTVQFNNGYIYEYYGVSLELWNAFIAAQPNPWSLVGYPQLVQAGVPYKRIG
jgi:hypothetical protein